jgi:hypothetical protein
VRAIADSNPNGTTAMDRSSRTWMSHPNANPSRFVYAVVAWGLLVSAWLSGCVGRGDVELLEANLRQQQDLAHRYQRQLEDLRGELATAHSELQQLRKDLADAGKPALQEQTEPLAKITGVEFNSMMTGGRDVDGSPGHDVLTAVLSPHDTDGDLLKLAGDIEIELLDLSRSGDKQRIGSWRYPANKARDLWHSGFLASGYQLDLPLTEHPQKGDALLHGRLTTADGRQFDTSYRVTLVGSPSGTPGSPPSDSARPLEVSQRVKRLDSAGEVVPAKAASSKSAAGSRPDFAEQEERAELSPAGGIPANGPIRRPVPIPPRDDVDDELPVTEEGRASPRPFPEAADFRKPEKMPVATSDHWTDATIPRWR